MDHGMDEKTRTESVALEPTRKELNTVKLYGGSWTESLRQGGLRCFESNVGGAAALVIKACCSQQEHFERLVICELKRCLLVMQGLDATSKDPVSRQSLGKTDSKPSTKEKPEVHWLQVYVSERLSLVRSTFGLGGYRKPTRIG
ncbi:hypothetical protein NL676_025685 [Syzygium grande]|nr:hypothetical protein NL676_025685 [Syzygium grande]